MTELLIAAASAVFAGISILVSMDWSRRQATLEHLREVDRRVQEIWQIDVEQVQQHILDVYSGSGAPLSPDGARYMAFLNAVDLLAFARANKVVHRKSVDRYARTLVPRTVDGRFIEALQSCLQDSEVYADILEYTRVLAKRKS